MKTVKQTAYRVEHFMDKKGMFQTTHKDWENDDDLHIAIIKNFYKINNMFYEFQGIVSYNKLFDYICGFKDINHVVSVLDFKLLESLNEFGFEIVEVKADVLIGETQVIFKDENLKRKVLTVNCIKKQLAKDKAKQDLKEEFKTLNIENYIVLN